MTDLDRGAYTPESEAPLSFDARRPQSGGGGPAPMALIISGMVLIVVVAAIAYFYRGGARTKDAPPQPVGAVLGATKAPPGPAEAQPVDPAEGLQIYDAQKPDPNAPTTFAQGPEQPQPRTAPAPPVASSPAPSNAGLRPTQPVAAAPKAEGASSAPAPAAPKPVPAAVAPPAKPTTATKPALVPAKPIPAATASAGAARVQIGAFSSTALADKGWNDAARIAPGAAAGKGKAVEAVNKDGHTLFRTSVTGFASRQDAASFCAALKAAGKDCFVK